MDDNPHDEPAEMQPRMRKVTSTLRMLAERSDDDAAWGALYDQWMALWENPDAYEQGDLFENVTDSDHQKALTLFELGVSFGIDYEQAYPEGRNDEWPIPLDARHAPCANCGGGDDD